ncbi:MAG: RNA polymerase sigma factor [Pseudomonadota bacterium]
MNDDNQCMAQLASGNTSALRELYQRHGRALLRFSSAMCRSRQVAEDMVHDTFVALLHEPFAFDPAQGTAFGYLCGVLRHRVSRHFRQQKRWVTLDTDDDASPVHASDARSPADEIARSEITAAFRHAMLELPLQHREIIALCDLEELPYTAVAGILQCPIGTVRSRLHRARALLTLRLASLELIDLQNDSPLTHRGLT